MEKLLIICDMFHCDMDSLVKGDMTLEDQADAAGYDRFMNSFSHRITGCVTLILAAVTLMTFLDGIVHEDILAIFLIAVVGVSVAVMIVTGINMEAFEKKYPHIQDFYSEEERSVFTRRFGIAIAFAVCLILFGICVNRAGFHKHPFKRTVFRRLFPALCHHCGWYVCVLWNSEGKVRGRGIQ